MIKDAMKLILAFVVLSGVPTVLIVHAIEAQTSMYRIGYASATMAWLILFVVVLIDSYHEL